MTRCTFASPQRDRRHGVVLLVMLGLLATFTLIVTTFVVSAGHFRRGATAASRAEITGDQPEVLLQQALMQVVRGSNHPLSAIGPHSLLEDVYGEDDSVCGMVMENAVISANGGTLIRADAIFSYYQLPVNLGTALASMEPSQYPRTIQQFPTNWTTVTSTAPNQQSPLWEFSGVGFGYDKEPGIAQFDDDSNGVIDDLSEFRTLGADDMLIGSTYAHPMHVGVPPQNWKDAWSAKTNTAAGLPLPILDNVDNYYAGRVITFVSGPAAGRSTIIVRSKAIPLDSGTVGNGFPCVTLFSVQPVYGNYRPGSSDRFIINGRAFSGLGIGSSPYQSNMDGNPGQYLAKAPNDPHNRRLDMRYVNPITANLGNDPFMQTFGSVGLPIALVPNPTDPGVRQYLHAASSMAAADEDYDAPDVQNMMLAYRMWNPRTGRYEVVMPSLHRPDLVHYFLRNLNGSDASKVRWTDLPPTVRRRLILRPDPSDHYDYTQDPAMDPTLTRWNPPEPFVDANLNQQWDVGESFTDTNGNGFYDIGDMPFANPGFDAILGNWDVDNDSDGTPDSIWVDLGLPVTTMPDGRFVKPLFAILCLDMDGRLNVNAHGSHKHYTAVDEYAPSGANRNALQQPVNTAPVNNYSEERQFLGPRGWAWGSANPPGSGYRKHDYTDVTVRKIVPGPSQMYATAYSGQSLTQVDFPQFGNRILNSFLEPAVNQGYSPADINLAALLYRYENSTARVPRTTGANLPQSWPRMNGYRTLLEGYVDNLRGAISTTPGSTHAAYTGNAPVNPGRYGEPEKKLSYGDQFPGLSTVARPGISRFSSDQAGIFAPLSLNILNTVASINRGGVTGTQTLSGGAVFQDNSADDDMPQAPSPKRNGAMVLRGNAGRDDLLTLTITTTGTGPATKYRSGVYGTPGDADSDGFLAIDLMGQPVYMGMGTPDESVDAPPEVNLYRSYAQKLNITDSAGTLRMTNNSVNNQTPMRTPVDSAFTPGELARVLMTGDPVASQFSNRMSLAASDGWDGDSWSLLRASATSEQWDIPCPHIAPTPELAQGLRELGLPVNNPSLGDLLRARFYLATRATVSGPTAVELVTRLATMAMRSYMMRTSEDFQNGTPTVASASVPQKHWLPHYPYTHRPSPLALKRQNCRLVPSDLVIGLKMDVNAPFGNSFDDDHDGVVDEPTEWADYGVAWANKAWGEFYPESNIVPGSLEPLWGTSAAIRTPPNRPTIFNFTNSVAFDGNNDGSYIQFFDENPRQQYAKHLYCLIMLLLDQNYVTPLESRYTNGLTATAGPETDLGTGWTTANGPNDPNRTTSAIRWLTARRIAQWAVNAVDFRDRDSIMTPFEFDVNPFFDDDGDCTLASMFVDRPLCNGTWDVDGVIIDDPSTSIAPAQKDSQRLWRGVVWGCEYPDLILTETLAFHDRRTANMGADTTGTGPASANLTTTPRTTGFYEPASIATGTCDTNWDQVRMPQGSLFVELYATGNQNLTFTSAAFGRTDSALPRELYTVDGRLDLGRVVVGRDLENITGSLTYRANPVWRLAITAARNVAASTPTDRNDVATMLAEHPSTCALDPVNGNFGVLTPTHNAQTIPNNSLLPYQIVQPTLTAPMITRIVALCTPTVSLTNPATGAAFGPIQSQNVAVNAKPEPIFTSTANPNPCDVFFHTYPAALAGNSTSISSALPGDYIVVGPYREAASDQQGTPDTSPTGLHNITTLGRTTRTMVTVYSSTGAIENNTRPHPIIDMGATYPGNSLLVSAHGEINVSRSFLITDTDRSFFVSNLSGADEYPRTASSALTPSFNIGGHNPLGALVATNIGAQPGVGNVPQIRRPVSIACAITDTFATNPANRGRPIGLNISEPLVTMTATTTQLNHRQLYRNSTLTANNTRWTTSDAWQPNLRWADTWTDPSPTEGRGGADDYPFDGSFFDPTLATPPAKFPLASPLTNTIRNHEFQEIGLQDLRDATYLRAKNVFLQRLADPTRLWHKDVNPYITIDWMPIDLTIFNGEFNLAGDTTAMPPVEGTEVRRRHEDPDNPDQNVYRQGRTGTPAATDYRRLRFGSRQRGSPSWAFSPQHPTNGTNQPGQLSSYDIWSQPNWLDERYDWDTRPALTIRADVDNGTRTSYDLRESMKWQHPLQHTLGYLNKGYQVFRNQARPPAARIQPDANAPAITNGEYRPIIRPPVNRPTAATGDWGWYSGWQGGTNSDIGDARYLGAPRRPFNWLTWNNRPYVSALELMQVPCVGPSRLLFEYDMRRTALPTLPANQATRSPLGRFPYDPRRSANPYLPFVSMPTTQQSGGYLVAPPFKHLLNFFNSAPAGANPGDFSTTQANFFRVFELLTVPTRFSGAATQHVHGLHAHPGPGAGGDGLWNSAKIVPQSGSGLQQPLLPLSNPMGMMNIGFLEHPGWPFTAPYNSIPRYREPGRVNVNTIPIIQPYGNATDIKVNATEEYYQLADSGALVWVGVTNDFFPWVRFSNAPNVITVPSTNARINMWSGTGTNRASNYPPASSASASVPITIQTRSDQPDQDTIHNFFTMFDGMRSDNREYSFKGLNGIWQRPPGGGVAIPPPAGTSDDRWWLMNSHPSRTPALERFDPRRPTWVTNPMRSYLEDFTATIPQPPFPNPQYPLPEYWQSADSLPSTGYPSNATMLSVDSTLLRRRDTTWRPWSSPAVSSPTSAQPNTPEQVEPLFDPLFSLNFPRPTTNSLNPGGTAVPGGLLATGYTMPMADAAPTSQNAILPKTTDYRNTDRNPFFRYQLYNKLGNTVTTRSNVYAIWVTIGFFECERISPTDVVQPQEGFAASSEFQTAQRFPDGFRIVREVGFESGETKRHRIFAIFDRSIPVGFKRGENYNVDRAFLYRQVLN